MSPRCKDCGNELLFEFETQGVDRYEYNPSTGAVDSVVEVHSETMAGPVCVQCGSVDVEVDDESGGSTQTDLSDLEDAVERAAEDLLDEMEDAETDVGGVSVECDTCGYSDVRKPRTECPMCGIGVLYA